MSDVPMRILEIPKSPIFTMSFFKNIFLYQFQKASDCYTVQRHFWQKVHDQQFHLLQNHLFWSNYYLFSELNSRAQEFLEFAKY